VRRTWHSPHSEQRVNWQLMRSVLSSCVLVSSSQGILERLDAGEIVIGDGGFVFALEKRGYVKAGPWTPEAAAEHPEAGKEQEEGEEEEEDPDPCTIFIVLAGRRTRLLHIPGL